MATKKQKRLAGEAKQAIYRAESIRTGLEAQKADRKLIAEKKKQAAINRKRAENASLINSIVQTDNTRDIFPSEESFGVADDQDRYADLDASMAGGMD